MQYPLPIYQLYTIHQNTLLRFANSEQPVLTIDVIDAARMKDILVDVACSVFTTSRNHHGTITEPFYYIVYARNGFFFDIGTLIRSFGLGDVTNNHYKISVNSGNLKPYIIVKKFNGNSVTEMLQVLTLDRIHIFIQSLINNIRYFYRYLHDKQKLRTKILCCQLPQIYGYFANSGKGLDVF